jgi:hypothetical protein
MKFSPAAVFGLLFNASASSFATNPTYKSSPVTTSSSLNLPFIYRGGASSASRLSATVDPPAKPSVSQENLELLSVRGQSAVSRLIENDVGGYQSHVYGHWPEPGVQDDDKRRLAEQVRSSLIVSLSRMKTILLTFLSLA